MKISLSKTIIIFTFYQSEQTGLLPCSMAFIFPVYNINGVLPKGSGFITSDFKFRFLKTDLEKWLLEGKIQPSSNAISPLSSNK